MFKIYDGRNQFYQWDIDRKLIVEDATIDQVHFCNRTDDCSLVCETYTENGLNLVNVPNILLQTDWRINVYAYDRNYTKFSEQFDVVRRSKPESYVYTETEVLNYNTLLEMIENIEVGPGGNVDLDGYATEEYVDNAVANVKVDLTGYATEKYVDDAIDAIEIPKTDLTGYATEKYVDDAIEAIDIPETDLTGYATEKYVDDAIAGIDIPDVSAYQTAEQVQTAISTALNAIGVAEEGAY